MDPFSLVGIIILIILLYFFGRIFSFLVKVAIIAFLVMLVVVFLFDISWGTIWHWITGWF
ncbi:hypothetical protein HYV86_05280 [Candidatus Woesearchaeota archaeon]|nr:hypothetical protein [Candidatus Woesearchaeota archaeon]